MKGHINITIDEVVYAGNEAYQFAVDCDVQTHSFGEKMTLVHTFLRALDFDEKDYKILAIAAVKNYWPDSKTTQAKFSLDREAIKKAQEAMGGNDHEK